jgi:hypothetical protein
MRTIGKRLLIGLLFCSLPSPAFARVSRFCNVSYETRVGWSEEARAELTFLTGAELNRATRTYDFNFYSVYALLWFDKGEVAIMEYTGVVFGVGQEFRSDDFRRLFQLLPEADFRQVNSQRDVNWRIKARLLFRFIDPRER